MISSTALRELYALIPDIEEKDKYVFTDMFDYAHASLDHKDSVHFSVAWLPNNPNAFTSYKILLDMLEKLYIQLQKVFKICAPSHAVSKKVVVYVGDMGGPIKADNNVILVDCNCEPIVALRQYIMSALKLQTSSMIGLNITRDRYVYETFVSFIIAHTFPSKLSDEFTIVHENSHFAIDASHNTEYSKSYNQHRVGYTPEDGYHLLNYVALMFGHNAIACLIHEVKLHSDVLLLETIEIVLKKDIPSLIADYVCDTLKNVDNVFFTNIVKDVDVFSPARKLECLAFHSVDLTRISPPTGTMYKISWTCKPRQDLWRVVVFTPEPIICTNGYDSMKIKSASHQFIVFIPCFRKKADDQVPSYSFLLSE